MNTKDYLDRIKEAEESGETDTQLGRALARWNDHQLCMWKDGKWLLEGFIMYFKKQREILSAIDPSISPDLPPHLLDPVQIAYFFGLPIEELNWPGIRGRSDAAVLQKLSSIEGRMEQVITAVSISGQGEPTRNGAEVRTGLKEKWLTISECADRSGRSKTTIRRAIKDGTLKAHAVGRGRRRPSYRVHPDDLRSFIEAGRVVAPDPPVVPSIGVRKKSRHFD